MTDWYDTFFDALAHDVWDALVPAEVSDEEAEWLVARLELDGGIRTLLDVPSGRGRHATRIAARGHRVVAVDFAPTAIDALAAHAPPTLSARRGDMRDLDAVLPDPAVFDGAWCLGNSFGYLDDAATARFLAGVARALRPGARFVIDLATAAEAVLPHLETDGVDRHQAGDVSLTNTHHYDALTSTLVTQMLLERGGERDERVVRHRVFTCREVIAALERAGFEVDGIDGDLDGHPFALGAPRCLLRAIRRAEAQPE